ncbi:Rap1 GTPase-activating protein 1 [Homalodisca vitripennis]|nr:Rap1 GTPase-activating protein 1 [Homalodisca vitripennis]
MVTHIVDVLFLWSCPGNTPLESADYDLPAATFPFPGKCPLVSLPASRSNGTPSRVCECASKESGCFQLGYQPLCNTTLDRGTRQDSCPASSSCSQELLEETLRGTAPYPMVVLPPGGGYWVDGHEPASASLAAPPHSWRTKFETDDTAKCYRRFFLGRLKAPRVKLIFRGEGVLKGMDQVFPSAAYSRLWQLSKSRLCNGD